MFSVERFGFSEKKRSNDSGEDEGRSRENKKVLSALLIKSKERLKVKENENEVNRRASKLARKVAAQANTSSVNKRKFEELKFETDEERKQRKALAKQAKKERKAKLRLESESVETNEEKHCEVLKESSEEIAIGAGDPFQRSEHDDDPPSKEEEKGLVTILQQLNPNANRRDDKILKKKVEFTEQDQSLDVEEEPESAVETQKESSQDEYSNQYKLEDSSTSEVFVPVTVKESVSSWGVDKDIAQILIDDGITSFFPVQTAVLPILLKSSQKTFLQPRDICVSAPTGSGKTLSYALPIIQVLKSRLVKRLRALILLPSRELASQVYRVFCHLASNTDLMIALATGQTQLETERDTLIDSSKTKRSLVDILICTPGRLLDHIQGTDGFTLEHCRYLVLDEADRLLGNAYDHWVRTLIRSTGVINSVQSSRDLAMRTYQYRQSPLFNADKGTSCNDGETIFKSMQKMDEFKNNKKKFSCVLQSQSRFLQRLLFSATLTDNPRKLSLLDIRNPLIIRTSLLPTDVSSSKTITAADNPEDGKRTTITTSNNSLQSTGYLLPSTLTETVLMCEAAQRPVTLIALLHECILQNPALEKINKNDNSFRDAHVGACHDLGCEGAGSILIFASSVDSAHRLCRLLQLYNGQLDSHVGKSMTHERVSDDGGANENESSAPLKFGGEVREMTRIINSEDRSITMGLAREGKVRVIVSSDQLARGIDLASVKIVINYDPPKHPRTYVHRVGRTARANRAGQSITMLKQGHLGEFKKLRKSIDDKYDNVGKTKVSKDAISSVESNYEYAIQHLNLIIDAETSGTLRPGSSC